MHNPQSNELVEAMMKMSNNLIKIEFYKKTHGFHYFWNRELLKFQAAFPVQWKFYLLERSEVTSETFQLKNTRISQIHDQLTCEEV